MSEAVTKQDLRDMEQRLVDLIQNLHDSTNREIGQVKESMKLVNIRLDKIAAGAHYVTRLVEWSEKQDALQADLIGRVQQLEAKVAQLEKKAS